MEMKIRKIAAAATFATGAALAFAPLASADTALLDSEISSQNSLFDFYALLAGDTVTKATTPTGFDSVPLSDVPQATDFGQVTTLDTDLYGTNPILAGISGDSGPYSEFNGALTQFYNAYDVAAYAAQNGNVLDTTQGDYIENNALNHALTLGTPQAAEQYLYNFGLGDLKGYDGDFTPTASGPGDIDPTISGEISSLNSLFELDGHLAGVYGDIVPEGSKAFGVGFDTIPTGDLNATFNDLVTGAAGPSGDPGSYDVMNGALTEFYNAFNVEDYSLLNSGALLPAVDVFGSHAAFLGDGVAGAVEDFLKLGTSDLAGFF
jgi:hypothetical protein